MNSENRKLLSSIRPGRSVVVDYLDDCYIIPNADEKSEDDHRKKAASSSSDIRNDFIVESLSPDKKKTTPRRTRSGRQIVSRFEQLSIISPEKSLTSKPRLDSSDEEEEEEERFEEEIERPQDLFEEDTPGREMYWFKSRKRQSGMVSKAVETVKSSVSTPRSNCRGGVTESERQESTTPSSRATQRKRVISQTTSEKKPQKAGRLDRIPAKTAPSTTLIFTNSKISEPLTKGTPSRKSLQEPEEARYVPKTPYGLRNRIRRKLAAEADVQELDRLLEDSGSDFKPSSSSSEEEAESSSAEEVASDTEESPPRQPREDDVQPITPSQPPPQSSHNLRTRSRKVKDYVFQSEDYFHRQGAKIQTSNNRLEKLKTPKMAPNKLTNILKGVERKHVHSIRLLESSIERCFRRWLFAFSQGFNVMLYGLGSKLHILEKFRERWLKDSYVFVLHGYFPDNTMREVLNALVASFFDDKEISRQPHESLEVIRTHLTGSGNVRRVFLLVSNLDGKFLQNDKNQTLLSQLVSIPHVHMVATVDHINSPLLWDQSKLSTYNFVWEDATTFATYSEETSYEGSLMVQWSGGIALSSLRSVFTSLNINSRKVFKILLNHHLENNGPKYPGMHFSELYRECRLGFVVSTDLALRTLLTEFTDHQIVKWKKDTDHLLVTVDSEVLKQFRPEMDYLN